MRHIPLSKLLSIVLLLVLVLGAALPAYAQGAPTANPNSYNTDENTTLTVSTFLGGLLGNDTDPDNDVLQVDRYTQPQNGSVTVNVLDGTFSYTPNPGFAGVDRFEYVATDGTFASAPATVTILVFASGTNDPPVLTAPASVTTPPGVSLVFNTINVSDIDISGGNLQVTITLTSGSGITGTLTLGGGSVTGDTDGSDGTLDFTGSLADINDALGGLTYAPDATLVGGDTVTMDITVSDLGNSGSGGAQTDTASITITIAGIVVDLGGGVVVYEGGASDTYTIRLSSAPTEDVVINITTDAQCTATTPVTLNSANWSAGVAVTVSATHDTIPEGDHSCLIEHSATGDPNFAGTEIDDVLVTIIDNDGGVIVNEGDGVNVAEGNATGDTYTFRLTSDPGDGQSVSVAITTPDGQCTVDSATLTFTGGAAGTWNVEQTVTVTAVDDGVVESNPHPCQINHLTSSAVSAYNGIPYTVVANVADNDTNTVLILHTGPDTSVTEGGLSDVYHVRLGSQPSGDVTVAVAVQGTPQQCTVNGLGSIALVFTPANWSTSQPVSVAAVDDDIVELNPHVCEIAHTPSGTPEYITPVTMSVNVYDNDAGANDPPVAVDDSYETTQNVPLTVDAPGVLANDSDPDFDPIFVIINSDPVNGTLALNQNGSFTYTPALDFVGTDQFNYRVSDGTDYSVNSAVVTIEVKAPTVNVPPVAVNDTYTATEAVLLTIPAPGVLGNDTDANGDTLVAQYVAGPSSGTLFLNADGSFTYTPNAGTAGTTDSFTYHAFDGTATSASPATVTINIQSPAVNTPPVAMNDAYTATEAVPLTITAPGVLGNDTDAESDPLQAQLVSGPSSGTLVLNPDGSFTYTANAGTGGTTDSFTYNASDGTATSAAPATVTITINAPGANTPPVAVDDNYTANEGTPLTIAAPGVLGNDTDAESDPLQAQLVSGPSSGTLVLNPDGSFTYTANAGTGGTTDTFLYNAFDGTATSTLSALVTITINPPAANTPPVAMNDAYTATEAVPLTIAAPGVLGNDTDAESDPLQAQLVSGPGSGTLVLNPDGSFTYTANAGTGGTTDSFTYNAFDGTAASAAPATVSITIDAPAANTSPVADGQTVSTSAGVPIAITLTGSDADSDPLTYAIGAPPTGGVLSGTAPNLVYTPNVGFSGSDSFTFVVSDGVATSAAALVTINVSAAANTAPVVNVAGVTTGVSGNLVVFHVPFTDNPGDTHTATINWGDGTGPQAALVNGYAVDGAYTYAAAGTYTITITISDSAGNHTVYSIIIDVGTGVVSYPPLVALCTDQNFVEGSVIRANVPDAIRHTVRCRPMVANGVYVNSPEEAALGSEHIGIHSVLEMGVEQAVDVFSPEGLVDLSGVTVCLKGTGTLLHLYGAPRTAHVVATYPVAAFAGFTCGSVPQTGTLVLVRNAGTLSVSVPNTSAPNSTSPFSPAPTPADPGLRLASFPECTAVTYGGTRLRAEPNERSQQIAVLGHGTPIILVTRVGMWYLVEYQGQQGYIRADLIAFNC